MTKKETNHPYITCDEKISGGVPIIKGTRMRVIQIAQEYIKLGYTPEDIINAHPHLTLAQIHDALSYYYEGKEDFDRKIEASLQNYESLKEKSPSKLKEYLERVPNVESL